MRILSQGAAPLLLLLMVLVAMPVTASGSAGMERPEPVAGEVWRYEGRWLRGDDTYHVEGTRETLAGDGAAWKTIERRVVADDDGPFSWSNETHWLDADGGLIRTNMTVITREDDGWRRIGIAIEYDAPCRRMQWPLVVGAEWSATCSGTRDVLGVEQAHEETTTYQGVAREEVDGFYAYRVDAKTPQGIVQTWYAPEVCGMVQEEVQGGGVHVSLRLVSYSCSGTTHEMMDTEKKDDGAVSVTPRAADTPQADKAERGVLTAADDETAGTGPDAGGDSASPAPADAVQEAPGLAPLIGLLVLCFVLRRRPVG